MKIYKTDELRNIVTGAHGGAGKSSLVEAMVFNMGQINRMGTIEQGTTVSDYHDDEIERQHSIGTSLLHGEWNNQKINIIDTPGYSDFFGEVVGSFRAADSAMVVISAGGGVEVGTEMVWEEAEKNGLPRIIVINKLDKENIDFDALLGSLQESFGHKVAPAQFPVNLGPGFDSVVDLIRMKLIKSQTDASGNFTEEEIPADFKEKADSARMK